VVSACLFAAVLVPSCSTFGVDEPNGVTDTDAGAGDAGGGAQGGGDGLADATVPEAAVVDMTDAARPPCAGEADCERYVFVTSDFYAGEDIGGAIGGDGRCAARASLPGTLPALLGRTFLAWMSDDSANLTASARLTHGKKAYRLANGALIANDWTQLTSGSLLHGIDLTERGETIGQDLVWTGTSALGEIASKNCTSWSINGVDNTGTVGRSNVTDSTWTNSGVAFCGTGHRLYCFEK
jgi:hypothetical protein